MTAGIRTVTDRRRYEVIYGKQDFKTLERGQENCYLMTNGLGGFSSMTMTGSVTRNDHAFLMACTQAPNHRYNMVHRLKERLFTGAPEEEDTYVLSSQEFADGTREEGFRYLSSFTYEDTPVWKFLVNGVEICKEATAEGKQAEPWPIMFSPWMWLPGRPERWKSYMKWSRGRRTRRKSTGGKTILAGFPFFEDWGRDTMIALPGICIFTGQYEIARQILRTFAVNERDGLMPNLFPEGGREPMYNTADAALLFINCVYLYYEASKDAVFVREMYPVMERIMKCYKNGTDFGIRMDEDGLIQAGEGLAQVTWMDVRVGDILPTPRHGKPVEINAYWYNALRIMERFYELLHSKDPGYGVLAGKVKAVFCDKFWLEEKGCLKDLVSGTPADVQIRCNQIWAVSLPFTMLDRDKEKRVVETVFEKLYTPYGLRTLDMGDAQFHPFYGGPMLERDMAYHQGTVWAFPLGAHYLAYLKVHDLDIKAAETVRSQLEVLESAMREGCIGQLPEIYGLNPVSSKGCFAQAWSVGELLRAYEKLERLQGGAQ
ncbi:MAG: amylo-alpha-1,6-glucosidase [Eisenbergiella porci]|mgnify:CR=1 FL=1|nr:MULTISPECIES: amylo-alpha-1,6-glucosidase [Eisenbergiella]MDY2652187.1 amylo-alpha-1,6-glucosidase [Eisenbergiella porci]